MRTSRWLRQAGCRQTESCRGSRPQGFCAGYHAAPPAGHSGGCAQKAAHPPRPRPACRPTAAAGDGRTAEQIDGPLFRRAEAQGRIAGRGIQAVVADARPGQQRQQIGGPFGQTVKDVIIGGDGNAVGQGHLCQQGRIGPKEKGLVLAPR